MRISPFVRVVVAVLLLADNHHALADTKISTLPAAGPLTGTESIPAVQAGSCAATGGTCQTTPAAITTYVNANASLPASAISSGILAGARMPAFSGDCTTSAGAVSVTCTKTQGLPFAASATTDTTNAGNINIGNLPIAQLPSVATNTVTANVSGSTGPSAAINALQFACMTGHPLTAFVTATSNITLSGSQTVDGQVIGTGQQVFAEAQGTSSQDGLYISASGAWARSPDFPAATIIGPNCNISVLTQSGTGNKGHIYALSTSGGSITVGTTAQTWVDTFPSASTTSLGGVKITGTVTTVPSLTASPTASGGKAGDCVSFSSLSGSVADLGNAGANNFGPCLIGDANGHPILDANGAGAPGIAGTGCSIDATSTDTDGWITATGADTCTITFTGAFSRAPVGTIGNVGPTVQASLSGKPTTTQAIFVTVAAGTFGYHLL